MTRAFNPPPSSQPYWDPELETRSRADWRAGALAALQRHLRFAYDTAPFFRAQFDAEYEALDRACDSVTAGESRIGAFVA